MFGEDVEGPVVAIGLDIVGALQTAHNEFEAGLHIFHAHGVRLFLEVGQRWLLELDPLLIFQLNIVRDLLPVKIQVMVIERIEKPILRNSISLDGEKSQPVGRDGQHQREDQRFLTIVVLILQEFVVKLHFAFYGSDHILVLELPSMSEEEETLMFAEDGKLLKLLHADLVVGSLEIPVEDVLLPPGPLIRFPVLFLDLQQELLDFHFESPEGSSTLDVVFALSAIEHLQETESVEYGMIAAEVG